MLYNFLKAVSLFPEERYSENYEGFVEDGRWFMQDGVTPIMEGITNLHNDIMFFLVNIIGFVFWMLFISIYCFRTSSNERPSKVVHGALIEIVWTIIPTLILLVIALPTFALLYSLDEAIEPEVTVKVIGHQWYWSYEYSDFCGDLGASDYSKYEEGTIAFDSFMVPDKDFEEWGQLRLLEVDNPLVLPINTHIRLLVTAADVIHSWAVPAFGVKMDGVPGRLNQVSLFINHTGTFYGQCSELCGANHGFMPIKVLAVTRAQYLNWWFLVW